MLSESLIQIFNRDLEALKKEITSYHNEKIIWKIDHDISNSAGNLCLHIVGNLNHFIGHVLGKTDYLRDREAEFNTKYVPVKSLIEEIETARNTIGSVLKNVPSEHLQGLYPLKVFGEEMSTEYFMIHLAAHLNYHLGQINYHRRLLDH